MVRALPPGRCRSAGPWLPGKSGQPEGSRSKDAVLKDAAAEAAAAGADSAGSGACVGPIGFRRYIARARVALETLAGPCVPGHCSPAAALERPGGNFVPAAARRKGLSNRGKAFQISAIDACQVHLIHSRRSTLSSGRHFFSKSVLTVRRGGAYNPPIDAAPRFTGPARCHRSFSDTFWCMTLLTKVRRWSFSRPSKGGSLAVPVL